MSVIMMLQSEHERLETLLRIIEREVEAIEQRQECDRSLLELALEYWRSYPDQCHHPKEDLLLAQMKRHGIAGADELHDRFAGAHETLAGLSATVADALRSSPGSTPELAALLRRFVDENRHHMALEEEFLFTAARSHLSEDDWDQVEFALLDRNDPVFNRPLEQRYHVLLDRILALDMRRNEQLKRSRMREFLTRGNPEGLGHISTIQDFNDIAGRAQFGDRYRLVEVPGQGFVLERNGTALLKIPPCDEQRASWCACFYLCGVESERERFSREPLLPPDRRGLPMTC